MKIVCPACVKEMWVGRRVEIPAHFDAWMRGARFGEVVQVRRTQYGADELGVRMDHPQIKRLIWADARLVKRV